MDQRVRREGEREGERAEEVKRECRRRLVEARGRAERGVTGGDGRLQGEVEGERYSSPLPLKRCKC
jgi:hypothetical protein